MSLSQRAVATVLLETTGYQDEELNRRIHLNAQATAAHARAVEQATADHDKAVEGERVAAAVVLLKTEGYEGDELRRLNEQNAQTTADHDKEVEQAAADHATAVEAGVLSEEICDGLLDMLGGLEQTGLLLPSSELVLVWILYCPPMDPL